MKKISLTKGYVALVDDEDYERVSKHKWRACVKPRSDGTALVFAQRHKRQDGGKYVGQFLHRFILDAPDGKEVDHINGDDLDNRRSNLRICTRAENARNQRAQTMGTSAYKGVTWHKGLSKWQAQIRHNGKCKYLGCFPDELSAALAYDVSAARLFGAFARFNFPNGGQTP